MNTNQIITIERGKRGGKPCIRGMSQQEILADFPYLTEADILASLGYAAARE